MTIFSYGNNTTEEIRCIEDYYNVTVDKITVRMICIHAIYGSLSQEIVMDMLSYMYGVYENIAVYGNDHVTRSKAHVTMNYFDEAVNLIDTNNYMCHLRSLAYEDIATTNTDTVGDNIQNYTNQHDGSYHPSGGSYYPSGASTPVLDEHQFLTTPPPPPHIIRINGFYDAYHDSELPTVHSHSRVVRNLFNDEQANTARNNDVNNEYSAWNVSTDGSLW